MAKKIKIIYSGPRYSIESLFFDLIEINKDDFNVEMDVCYGYDDEKIIKNLNDGKKYDIIIIHIGTGRMRYFAELTEKIRRLSNAKLIAESNMSPIRGSDLSNYFDYYTEGLAGKKSTFEWILENYEKFS